jgi:hypothetical protein
MRRRESALLSREALRFVATTRIKGAFVTRTGDRIDVIDVIQGVEIVDARGDF